MSITLDGFTFELDNFVGDDGLGHADIQAATTGAISGATYPEEPLFPDRIFRAFLNQLAVDNATTSNTSHNISTGSKTFTLAQQILSVGEFVVIASTAGPSNYLYGQVTAISGNDATVNVTAIAGSGTAITSWSVKGGAGIQGATGSGVPSINGGGSDDGKLVYINGTVAALSSLVITNILAKNATATLTAGYAATVYDAGTKSSGTFTPSEANGNIQKAVNGGAHTLAPPTNDTCITIQYTNNGSAGAITTSGFTRVTGDSLTTTNGDDFFLHITKINGFSTINVVALQ